MDAAPSSPLGAVGAMSSAKTDEQLAECAADEMKCGSQITAEWSIAYNGVLRGIKLGRLLGERARLEKIGTDWETTLTAEWCGCGDKHAYTCVGSAWITDRIAAIDKELGDNK